MIESLMVVDTWFKVANQTECITLEKLYDEQIVKIGKQVANKFNEISKITNSFVTKLPKLSK